MKKFLSFLTTLFFLIMPDLADAKCFLVKEKGKIIKRIGECHTRHAPASTFKIALALMGYNEGFLVDETHPELPFKKGCLDWYKVWKQPHTPTTWIKNSCIWYSHAITQKIGMEKFQAYVRKFSYGNQDVSGDKGKNNGLTRAWISSSLQISPEEQIMFLEKLLDHNLPVSQKAQEMTKKILFIEELVGGWKLYGKTGLGVLLNKDGSRKKGSRRCWFVGWLSKGERTLIFAYYLEEKDKDSVTPQWAKEEVKRHLMDLIERH